MQDHQREDPTKLGSTVSKGTRLFKISFHDGIRFHEGEEDRRSVLIKTWSSIVTAVASLLAGAVATLATSPSIYRAMRDRWIILVAIMVALTTVALTVTFALRRPRKSRRLTEDVTQAYLRALVVSTINPCVGGTTRG